MVLVKQEAECEACYRDVPRATMKRFDGFLVCPPCLTLMRNA